MKKLLSLTLAIFLLLSLFCSCTYIVKDEDTRITDAREKEFLNAINERDEEAIKNMFSKKARKDAGNIDAKELLSFIEGKGVSFTREDDPVCFEDFEEGDRRKKLFTWYTLETDEHLFYKIYMIDYPVDSITPENEGVYSLRILRLEDWDYDNFGPLMEDWEIPGIYIYKDKKV